MNETLQLALNRNVTSIGIQKFNKMRGGVCHLFTSYLSEMAPIKKYASLRPETFLGSFKNTEKNGHVNAGVPETMQESLSYRGGIQVKGAGPFAGSNGA